jgi:hypothetical protein
MAFPLLTMVTRWRRWRLCDVKYSAACSGVLMLVTVVTNLRNFCYVTAQDNTIAMVVDPACSG